MNYSVVEYFVEHEGHRCGYCKSSDTNLSHGMWSHFLTVDDYQALVNRGWRRSGQYCYKPTMNRTCCPQYTIKCETANFKLSKSQKKVLKKVNSFLKNGMKSKEETKQTNDESQPNVNNVDEHPEFIYSRNKSKITDVADLRDLTQTRRSNQIPKSTVSESSNSDKMETHTGSLKKSVMGLDSNRPPCRKAKVIRKENYQKKLAENQEVRHVKSNDKIKSLEDYLNEASAPGLKHQLQIKLVRSSLRSSEFHESFSKSYELYKKYQMFVHKDSPEDCNESTFTDFLVNSPLQEETRNPGSPVGYGSFHQQYWLDDQLIGVGVIDIMPNFVSSVYFYYDPSYGFLSLGTYSALREIALTRDLNKYSSELEYYYMGFFIHSCPKLKYKANYFPSFLLCPETYKWFPVQESCLKIEKQKYSRLNEDMDEGDDDKVTDISDVLILYNGRIMTYSTYVAKSGSRESQSAVEEYAGFIGNKMTRSLLLYRS